MLVGLLSFFGSSRVTSGSFGELSAESGLAIGRPANGLRIDLAGSGFGYITLWGGMTGMLLLDCNAGLSLGVCSCLAISVSVRLRLANLDGGGGLDPDGRDSRCVRRSVRYVAVVTNR